MREAFSQRQDIKLNNNQEKKEDRRGNKPKRKTPVKKETLQKLTELGIDATKIVFEEDAQALIEEKTKDKPQEEPKRSKKEQIRYEAIQLAKSMHIKVSEDVGTKAILQSIKDMIDEMKEEAGNDIGQMAEALSYEVSYKAICTENEIYHNTTSGRGVASLADYNRFRLGL